MFGRISFLSPKVSTRQVNVPVAGPALVCVPGFWGGQGHLSSPCAALVRWLPGSALPSKDKGISYSGFGVTLDPGQTSKGFF